ncbi:Reticulon-domain-containing protein [Nemania sp. NC0429]|nr:Reticulon-domain-containing protein [Nemania sp. NC0429]
MATKSTANGGSSVDTLKGITVVPRRRDEKESERQRTLDSVYYSTATIAAAVFPPSISSLRHAQVAYDRIANGPVAANVKDQTAKTSAEFSNLAGARRTPANPAATGQPLTHYHSFFPELLSWNNPRASAIAYTGIVALIFAFRYLDIVRYAFKLTWMALGVTVLGEVTGKAILGRGLTSQLRPHKYYTVSREVIDSLAGDVFELVNFFVIESQRILFAENVAVSTAAAVAALFSYFLTKIVPYWGLALIGTTVLFLAPLIYTTNKELIDEYLKQGSELVSSQTEQLRQVAGEHTSHATEIAKQYVGDYTTKAQSLLHRGGSTSPEPTSKSGPQSGIKEADFPEPPKQDFGSEGVDVVGVEPVTA